MKWVLSAFLCALLSMVSFVARSEITPEPTRFDPRIKQVRYDENDIVEITASFFYTTVVEFADHEEVLMVSLGNEDAWAYEASDNRLYLKPVDTVSNVTKTNLHIETSARQYYFALTGIESDEKETTHVVRFVYPKEIKLLRKRQEEALSTFRSQEIETAQGISPQDMHHFYEFSGDESLKPHSVFDDGTFTYFLFDEQQPIPAIFMVDGSDIGQPSERLLNPHRRGQYIVVERVANQFSLRRDGALTCIYRGKAS